MQPSATNAKVASVSPPPDEARTGSAAQDSTIRVNVNLLDKLMNFVGEVVLAQPDPAVRRKPRRCGVSRNDPAAEPGYDRASRGVMKTRMQPISRLFDNVPRVVRDVSMACRKQVRVETEGKETELDRTLLEAMNAPLTHLVRNAIDHGIERPEQRVGAGMPLEGVMRLRALHEGGQVTIEISDDGAGIDALLSARGHEAALERYWGERLPNPQVLRRLHAQVGVDCRYLALPMEDYPKLSGWGEANDHWIRTAQDLGECAIKRAATHARLDVRDLGAFFFTSVTGIASPSIEARLINRMGLRQRFDAYQCLGLVAWLERRAFRG